jgi:murein L,D-transpeptidase YcbB/YkuD
MAIVVGATLLAGRRAPATAAGAITLRLNLPAMRIDVLADSFVTRSYDVAVGERRFRTPVGAFVVTRVIWNPWWIPPDAEWARKEKITPPGPANPMGKVKLLLGGPYYLHGTPFPASIGHAASHGCIRMRNEDAIELARLLQVEAGAEIAAAATDSLAGTLYDTRAVELPRPIPMQVVYELAEVRGDSLLLYPDVYRGRHGSPRAHVLAALAGAGFDTTKADRDALRSVLAKARRNRLTVALDQVLPRAADAVPPPI